MPKRPYKLRAKVGISRLEFAKREGCSYPYVGQRIKTGHLKMLPDGSIDPALVGSDWRQRRGPVDEVDEGLKREAEQFAQRAGTSLSFADAQRLKEIYFYKLRELQYDRESGEVVDIAAAAKEVTTHYAVVRNRLLGLGAKIAPRAAILRSPEQVKALIDAEVIAALEESTLDGRYSADGGGASAFNTV